MFRAMIILKAQGKPNGSKKPSGMIHFCIQGTLTYSGLASPILRQKTLPFLLLNHISINKNLEEKRSLEINVT